MNMSAISDLMTGLRVYGNNTKWTWSDKSIGHSYDDNVIGSSVFSVDVYCNAAWSPRGRLTMEYDTKGSPIPRQGEPEGRRYRGERREGGAAQSATRARLPTRHIEGPITYLSPPHKK